MSEDIQAPSAPDTTEDSTAVSANAAVARCRSAWERAYKAEMTKGKYTVYATSAAARAYRDAMPLLSGYESTRDFIACTAQGILIGAIDEKAASKLLYAAQVTLTSVRSKPTKPAPAA
jgi:hypothetical protein